MLTLFCFSPSSISSVFHYSAHKYKVSQNISDFTLNPLSSPSAGISPAQCMSDDSYHQPPVSIHIPQSFDIRTYYFNWRLTRSLVNPFQYTHVHHICEYHHLLCTASSPFYTVQCAGSHRFKFLNPDHSYPYLVVQFTILPSILSHLPLTYTCPCTLNSCPVIYVSWRDLSGPLYP